MFQSMMMVTSALVLVVALSGCSDSPTPSSSEPTNAKPIVQPPAPAPAAAPADEVPALLNFTMDDIAGQPVNLSQYAGKVVMFVNVASKCGYTKQYPALEELYKKYKDRGFVLIGVPANDFRQQEPGTNAEIAEFCTTNYGVTFAMMAKAHVIGDQQCPLYKALVAAASANGLAETGPVKWNFEKFLLNRKGELVGRFRSAVTPMSEPITGAVEQALQ